MISTHRLNLALKYGGRLALLVTSDLRVPDLQQTRGTEQ